MHAICTSVCPRPAGAQVGCYGFTIFSNRFKVWNAFACSLSLEYVRQDRNKRSSRRPVLPRENPTVAACAPSNSTDILNATARSAESSLSRQQHDAQDSHEGTEYAGRKPKTSTSVFDVMTNMAQDPTLLVLFHPYLPKDKRTHAALSKAMAIDRWRRNILTGESQVRESQIMFNVRQRAPDRDALNKELRQLGFHELVKD